MRRAGACGRQGAVRCVARRESVSSRRCIQQLNPQVEDHRHAPCARVFCRPGFHCHRGRARLARRLTRGLRRGQSERAGKRSPSVASVPAHRSLRPRGNRVGSRQQRDDCHRKSVSGWSDRIGRGQHAPYRQNRWPALVAFAAGRWSGADAADRRHLQGSAPHRRLRRRPGTGRCGERPRFAYIEFGRYVAENRRSASANVTCLRVGRDDRGAGRSRHRSAGFHLRRRRLPCGESRERQRNRYRERCGGRHRSRAPKTQGEYFGGGQHRVSGRSRRRAASERRGPRKEAQGERNGPDAHRTLFA